MATKGKTRGPKESKHVKKTQKQDANYSTKRKKQEKEIGAAKK
jgi:hypothetical protein